MIVVISDTIVMMTVEEARTVTDRIRRAADDLWRLLLEAHERRAWQALGYTSWRAYAQAEFQMGQSHAYRLLDYGRVLRVPEDVVGSPMGEIVTERVARDLKSQIHTVTNDIRNRIEAGEDPWDAAEATISKARTTSYLNSRKQADRDNRSLEVFALELTTTLDMFDTYPIVDVDRNRAPEWVAEFRSAARRLTRLADQLEREVGR